jgi:hypothetical protein
MTKTGACQQQIGILLVQTTTSERHRPRAVHLGRKLRERCETANFDLVILRTCHAIRSDNSI